MNQIVWSRKDLRAKGRQALHLNYWKLVLVCFLLMLLSGSFSDSLASTSQDFSQGFVQGYTDGAEDQGEDLELDYGLTGDGTVYIKQIEDVQAVEDTEEVQDTEAGEETEEENSTDIRFLLVSVFIFLGLFSVIFVVVFMLVSLYMALVYNPFEVGASRFFLRGLHRPAELKEVFYGFEHSYKNIVGVRLLQMVYTMLWSMLFLIPGIVKKYEYRMIPYLLAENPSMKAEEAFAKSKEMMMGQKWKAFLLDLSFLGWDLLSLVTMGILGIFYVLPYKNETNAALYETLKQGKLMESEA